MKKFGKYLFMGILLLVISGCGNSVQDENHGNVETQITEDATQSEESFDLFHNEKQNRMDYEFLQEAELKIETGEKVLDGIPLIASLKIMLPQDGVKRINKGKAEAEKYGAKIKVELNPKILNSQKEYPIYEQLRIIMENYIKSYEKYKDVMSYGIEDISESSARLSLKYVTSDELGVVSHDVTCYLIRLSEELSVFLSVDIGYDKVVDETEQFIAELEDFYGVDIVYVQEHAQEYVEQYLENIIHQTKTFHYQTIQFELPDYWALDTRFQYPNMQIYGPYGRGIESQCVIMVSQDNSEFDSDQYLFYDFSDEMQELFNQIYNDSMSDLEITDAGKTFLGDTVRMTCNLKDINGNMQQMVIYCGLTTNQINQIGALKGPDAQEDVFAILENIMKSGNK